MLDFFVVPDIEDIIHSSIKPNPIARTFKTCLKVLGSSAGSPRCGYRRAHRRLRFSRGRHRTRGIAYRLRVGVRRWKCRGSTYRLRLLDFVGEFRLCYTNGAEAGRIVFFFFVCVFIGAERLRGSSLSGKASSRKLFGSRRLPWWMRACFLHHRGLERASGGLLPGRPHFGLLADLQGCRT